MMALNIVQVPRSIGWVSAAIFLIMCEDEELVLWLSEHSRPDSALNLSKYTIVYQLTYNTIKERPTTFVLYTIYHYFIVFARNQYLFDDQAKVFCIPPG